MSLFVMRGVAPEGTKMKDIYLGAIPFIGLIMLVLGLVLVFPSIALWLPGLMK
jgi:TRAP-type mannitol/chloroaromatic compound transport system permease large subunit